MFLCSVIWGILVGKWGGRGGVERGSGFSNLFLSFFVCFCWLFLLGTRKWLMKMLK